MKKILNFVIVFALIILTCGMSKQGHSVLWNNVFGISDYNSRQNIQSLWDTAQEVIDEYDEDYKELRKNFDWFTWGSYGHRLLFHWGFNANPKKYPPLVNQIKSCLKERKDAEEQENKFFAYLTRNIQAKRNRKLIASVERVTGIPASRAIATILYDVHLLGDYSTVNISALPKISDIENDLILHGFSVLMGGEKTKRLAEIQSEFLSAIRVGRGRINSKRAELLLETVKKFLPQILNERFKNTLQQKGIIITTSN